MRALNEAIKFFALLLLVIMVLPTVLLTLGTYMGDGTYQGLWFEILDLLPFGGAVGKMVLKFTSTFGSNALDAQKYMSQIQPLSPIEFIGELSKTCMVATVYEVVSKIGDLVMEDPKKGSIFLTLKKGLWRIVSAFIACWLGGLVMQLTFETIYNKISNGAFQWATTVLVLLLTLVVSVFFLWLTTGLFGRLMRENKYEKKKIIGLFAGYSTIKLIGINLVSIFASGAFMSFVVLNYAEGTWSLVIAGMAGWGVVLILFVAIDMILESAFG